MAIMTTQERIAGEARVRAMLGVAMVGAHAADEGREPVCSDTLLETEREILGVQMYAFGEVWSRPALGLETRCFIALASTGALGRSSEVEFYVEAALNLGISPEDVLEALLHMGIYAGLSASTIAIDVARRVFTERGLRKSGGGDPIVPRIPMTAEERAAAFRRVTTDLGVNMIGTGPNARPLAKLKSGPWSISAFDLPLEREIGTINGQHGYGETWGRPALGYRTRSFVTMATLQAVNENDQLHCHVNVALNLGITPEDIHEAMMQVGVYCGLSGWRNAANVARDVFLQREIVAPVAEAA